MGMSESPGARERSSTARHRLASLGQHRRRAAIAAVALTSLIASSALVSLSAAPASAAPALARPYDFDGNGYPDLAIGAPKLRVNKVRRAGGVVVLPSSKKGPSLREKIITQSSRGVPGASETDDQFGYAVASADFNRDGYADLAVGQPSETASVFEAGAVTVTYGSRKGLDTAKSVSITQSGAAEGAAWGWALATLDVNIDGYPDLAVGAPRSLTHDKVGGTVGVLPGGPGGLSRTPIAVLNGQRSADPADPSRDSHVMFGAGLAAGDLDGDHDTDLVVLSAGGLGGSDWYPGSVTACLTQSGQVSGCRRLLHDEDHLGFTAVAVGNVSGDAGQEIVIGSPGWFGPGITYGTVTTLQLRRNGELSVGGMADLWQDSPGVPGATDLDDGFGFDLVLGDIDRDGWADLVVGAPGQSRERGRVTVIHGGRAGWRTSGNYSYTQNTKGIPGKAERGDLFGASVTLLDHNRDGRLDLTVGAPGENRRSGVITTLPGSGKRFSPSRSRTFGLPRLGYRHPGGADFGASLGR